MPDDFTVQLDDILTRAEERLQQLPLAIALDALARLKELTPVKTGNLRASWSLSVEPDAIRITTGVIYARRVNYGFVGEDSLGRYYDQKGRHMVEQVISELPQIAQAAAERLGVQ